MWDIFKIKKPSCEKCKSKALKLYQKPRLRGNGYITFAECKKCGHNFCLKS